MFKKLALTMLAVGTSYAMEDITNTPTGDDNIKQTVEEVKQTTDDKVNEVTDDLSILNIDKTVEQMDNIKVEENKTNDKKEAKDKKEISDNKFTNNDVFFYNSNGEKLVDIEKLEKSKPYKEMTDDEKDWIKLRAYDNFLKSCHDFICIGLARKDANLKLRNFFYNTNTMKWCVLTGLDPKDLFLMELQSITGASHYELCHAYDQVRQQFDLVSKYLVHVKENLRARILKKGCVDKFE